jgi:hypothetical protein
MHAEIVLPASEKTFRPHRPKNSVAGEKISLTHTRNLLDANITVFYKLFLSSKCIKNLRKQYGWKVGFLQKYKLIIWINNLQISSTPFLPLFCQIWRKFGRQFFPASLEFCGRNFVCLATPPILKEGSKLYSLFIYLPFDWAKVTIVPIYTYIVISV